MTIEAARLSVVVDADTKDGESGLDRMGGAVGGFGKALGGIALAAGGAGLAVGGFAVKSAMGLQDAFAPVGTLLGANTTQMGEMTAAMKDFVSNSPTSAEDVGMAAYMALSSGITGTKNVTDALTSSQQLASAGLGTIGGSMDLVTSAMNSFKSEGLTADSAAQAFFGTIASGKTTTEGLAQGFGQIAPMAAGMGVKFNDLLAATAAITATGASASTAYAGLKGALTAIVAPTSEASDTAKKLGLDFSQAHLAAVGLPTFLDEVKTATAGNVSTMASLFGGVEGLNTVMALTGPQADAFKNNLTNIGVAGQQLGTRAAEMENTTSNRFAEMKNKVIVALGGVGEKIIGYLLPKFEEAQQWVSDHWPQIQEVVHNVMAGISEAWESVGRPVLDKIIEIGTQVVDWIVTNWPQISATISAVITEIVGVVQQYWPQVSAIITEVMETVRDIITTVLAVVKTIWDNYGTIILGLVKTVWEYISSTISAVMEVIHGVINVIMGLINGDWDKAWKGIKQIFTGIWDGIKAYVDLIIGEIKAILAAAWVFIQDAVDVAWSAIKGVAVSAWNGIKDAIMLPINTARDLIAGVWNTISSAASTAWDTLKSAASTAFNVVKDFVTAPIQAAKDIISGIWDSIVTIVTGIGSRISGALGGLKDMILSPFKTAFNAIVTAWNHTIGGLGFTIPSWLPEIGGKSFKVPELNYWYHTGGVVGGPAGGDVLAMLQVGEMVLTRQQQQAVTSAVTSGRGGSSSGNYTFAPVINVTTADRGELIGSEIVKALVRYERDAGRVWVRADQGII